MPAFDIQRAEDMLQDILDEHAFLSIEAKGFGLRLGASIPKGLMPLEEAQKIVAGFDANTRKLQSFINGLNNISDVPSKDFADEFDALYTKATKAFDKFKTDLKKAQEALIKYEDILVGEHFQESFEAVRHAILDFDLADNIDIDFKTNLYLDANPAYGEGVVILKKGTETAYEVTVIYRATDDLYAGSIKSSKRRKTFSNIVTKNGHTRLPAFVRELVGQLKALDDADGTEVFRSRKKVELTIEDPEAIASELQKLISEEYVNRGRPLSWGSHVSFYRGESAWGSASTQYIGWEYTKSIRKGLLEQHHAKMIEARSRLNQPFTAKVSRNVWKVTPTVKSVSVKVKDSMGYISYYNEKMAPGYLEKKDIIAIAQLLVIEFDIEKESVRSASYRMAKERFMNRTAGASDFYTYIEIADVKMAFRKAKVDVGYDRGHDTYAGNITSKSGYEIMKQEPMTSAEAYEYAYKTVERNDKWDSDAFAIPITKETLLKTETVTVTVEAKSEQDALRMGSIRIKATGRIPPKASIVIEKAVVKKTGGGPRVSTYEVTANRKQVITGEIKGWLFYGMAPS